jgi:hypothetical protein
VNYFLATSSSKLTHDAAVDVRISGILPIFFFLVSFVIVVAMRLSGLQREVLGLYRQCLRESRKKPQVSSICRCMMITAS